LQARQGGRRIDPGEHVTYDPHIGLMQGQPGDVRNHGVPNCRGRIGEGCMSEAGPMHGRCERRRCGDDDVVSEAMAGDTKRDERAQVISARGCRQQHVHPPPPQSIQTRDRADGHGAPPAPAVARSGADVAASRTSSRREAPGRAVGPQLKREIRTGSTSFHRYAAPKPSGGWRSRERGVCIGVWTVLL
jgi:hypothetical protein